MYGDSLAAVQRAQQTVDRQREIRELEGVVQVFERRMEEPLCLFPGGDAPDHKQTRDDRVDPECRRQRGGLRLVDGKMIPDEGAGARLLTSDF